MTHSGMNELAQKHLPGLLNTLTAHIQAMEETPERLKEAMLYSLQAGGKRIRPLLLIAATESYREVPPAAYELGAALEMVHTYSLIHDDLPSMDDDEIRRGKPTNHKVFGEALAILAGDALLTESFRLLSNISENELAPRDIVFLTRRLSEASGARGMVAGQVADIAAEGKKLSLPELEWIHQHKTGALLSFAVEAGGLLGQAPEQDLDSLRTFSKEIGIAFQIKDDILDIEGDEALIGKPIGSDSGNEKNTYPSLMTLEESKQKLRVHMERAEAAIRALSVPAPNLLNVLTYIEARDH